MRVSPVRQHTFGAILQNLPHGKEPGILGQMSVSTPTVSDLDSVLAAANVLLHVAAQSVLEVEEIVTTPQLRVLILISLSGPQSLGAVAAELGVHPSNATRTCERLVQADLIARSDNPTDRRYVHLTLTDQGAALVEHVLQRRRKAMAAVLSTMPEPLRDATTSAFQAFADAAGGEGTRDGRFTFGT